uniref:ATP synthase complex subunit 8 n=1 Tax=Pachydactylus punctatus TaxID=185352 RepID=A0A7R7J393_9SAUR|nr:ATPase subunit 8 [Pachydactylus punctatus]
MPQLNPTPWFTTLTALWVILLLLLPTLLHLQHPPLPQKSVNQAHKTPWHWTW